MAEVIVVAGRGNVGRSLVRAFHAAGHDARLVSAREALPRIDEGIVFIAVPDSAVLEVAKRLARSKADPAVSFVHTSGALGLDALEPLAGEHAVGSFHPLQTFPSPQAPEVFQGITVAIDASTTKLERRLAQLARDLGGRPRHVGDAERVLYHAAAVMASNYVIAVVSEAVAVLKGAGWSTEEAELALMPLVEGTVANLGRSGVTGALTGPIRRGDAVTVAKHVQALGKGPAEELYRMLGLVTLEIAKQAGLEPAAVGRTRRALTRHVAATQRRGRR